jgi:hypothetical protein
VTGAAAGGLRVRPAPAFRPLAWVADAGQLLFLIWCIPAGILLLGLPLVAVVRLALELVNRVLGR